MFYSQSLSHVITANKVAPVLQDQTEEDPVGEKRSPVGNCLPQPTQLVNHNQILSGKR